MRFVSDRVAEDRRDMGGRKGKGSWNTERKGQEKEEQGGVGEGETMELEAWVERWTDVAEINGGCRDATCCRLRDYRGWFPVRRDPKGSRCHPATPVRSENHGRAYITTSIPKLTIRVSGSRQRNSGLSFITTKTHYRYPV